MEQNCRLNMLSNFRSEREKYLADATDLKPSKHIDKLVYFYSYSTTRKDITLSYLGTLTRISIRTQRVARVAVAGVAPDGVGAAVGTAARGCQALVVVAAVRA